MSSNPRSLKWAVLLMSLLLMAVVACQTKASSTTVPTPTATTVPTPTPPPFPSPITADPDADPAGFFKALPQDESACVVTALGQARVDQITGGVEPTDKEKQVLEGCLSQETFARIMIGEVVRRAGGLSDETLGCMWDSLAGADVKALSSMESEDSIGGLGAFLSMALCLSDEEAALLLEGVGPDELPIAEMRCVAEQLDMGMLADMFAGGAAEMSPEVLLAMLECGLAAMGDEGDGPPFTAEQFACLQTALNEDDMAAMFGGEGGPNVEIMLAMLECGLEGGPDGDGIPFNAEQLACLQGVLSADDMAAMISDESRPSVEIMLAMLECGLEGGPDGDGIPFNAEQLTCLQAALSADDMAAMMGGEGAPSLEIMLAALKCGLATPDAEGDGLPFTADQLVCLEATLGRELLDQLIGQEGEPSIQVVLAALECGLDLRDSGDGPTDSGGPASGIDGLPVTAEQLACLVDGLGDGAIEELLSGQRTPNFGDLLVLAACNLDLEAILSGG